MGIFLSPKNFSSVRISQLKVQWSENYNDQTLPFRKLQPEKRLSRIQTTFQSKNLLKMDKLYNFLDVRKSQERQASKTFNTKCSENSRSQIVFRTYIFRKFTLGAPVFNGRGQQNIVCDPLSPFIELFCVRQSMFQFICCYKVN